MQRIFQTAAWLTLAHPYYASRANARKQMAILGRLLERIRRRCRWMHGEVCDLDPRKDHGSSQQSSRKRLNSCWPWIATNDVRYRGASLRFGLSMRHEGGRPARASNRGAEGKPILSARRVT